MSSHVKLLNPKPKRRVNCAFNSYIAPRATDIERVEGERRYLVNMRWINKGMQK